MHRGITTAIAVVSLLCVGGAAWWASQERTSPGPLHPSHAGVKVLRKGSACAECHGSTPQDMAGACLNCHDEVRDQAASALGLHGSLEQSTLASCGTCHREHLGGGIALVSELSFQLAEVPELEKYDHKHVGGFRLEGAHTDLSCAKCHEHADDAVLSEGASRFLGKSWACAACHEDVHKGTLGVDCASCHGQREPFKVVAEFEHPESFPLDLGHAGRRCVECHNPPEYTGASTDCASCHRDDYDKTTKPSHAAAKLGTDCATCHTTKAWATEVRFEHPRSFLLEGGHAGVECAQCHAPGARQDQVDRFKQDRACTACHDSPHAETFVARSAALAGAGSPEQSCGTCHQATDKRFGDAVARLTPTQHAASGFALATPHASVECAKCHEAAGDSGRWARAFPGRSSENCGACHQDPHEGQFDRGASAGKCLSCHEPVRFQPTAFDATRHAASAFPLTGSHKAVACVLCHKPERGVKRFVPTDTACSGCHQDVHRGRFDARGMAREVRGHSGCARCHTTESFSSVAWEVGDHERWTGYALVGGHARASCAQCHGGSSGTKFRAAAKDCASCHDDPHAGQFAARGVTDCARCHAEGDRFTPVRFDHARDSRFVLDEHHASLACAACHKEYTAGGRKLIRYKPLGVRCEDCHGTTGGKR